MLDQFFPLTKPWTLQLEAFHFYESLRRTTKTKLSLALAFTAISFVLHLGFVVVVVLDYFGVHAHLYKLAAVVFNRDGTIEVGCFYNHC